ncbi:MAG: hypothetical protein E6X17_10565 [Sporomusaceae bacterium]|nr:hypothetical protein [Sporomusaceae bacterium]
MPQEQDTCRSGVLFLHIPGRPGCSRSGSTNNRQTSALTVSN